MRKLSLALLCALALGACVAPPEDIDRVPNFDPAETLMGQIQVREELRIGIPEDAGPPFIMANGTTFEVEGFIPDLSNEIAQALDVDVEYLFLDEDDAILPGRPTVTAPVDISFVSIPATEELAKGHPLTHPYWVAHQRVLAPVDSGIEEWTDIEGSFCAILDESTGFDPSEADPSLERIDGTVRECASLLKKGRVDAVTAPDIDLMGVWASLGSCQQPCEPSPGYAIVGDELTTEGYSALLPVGSPGWTNFVNATWGEAEAEGRWLDSYEEWIAPFGIVLEEAPDMRIEEAAGLFPCESAC
jgi:polar amino acid transport system substrate-binding protein